MVKNISIFLLVLAISGCSFFKKKKAVDKDVLARVNDEYLYLSDVQGLTKGAKGSDSVEILKNYADNWIRKKLLLQKAKENIADDDVSITKKVEDYRETLLLYEYEKALVNKRLDTVIKADELNTEYEKLKADFRLETDVYQLLFIKLKKDAPDIDNVRKWVTKPKDEEDVRKLEGYCKEYAVTYVTDNGIWYEKESLLKNFPLSEYDISALNNTRSYKEFKTDGGVWYIKIVDALKKDQPSPLQFIQDKIVKAIIERRKLELVEKIYDRIYQEGIKAKSFEVTVK